MVVEIFLDTVDYLVDTVIYGVIVMIDKPVDVVPSSISPPILVTGGTLEALGLPWTLLSLLLGTYDL